MGSIDSRLKKAESYASEIGCDQETYITACMDFCRGDERALAALPPIKGGREKFAAYLINAKSRIENEERQKMAAGRNVNEQY